MNTLNINNGIEIRTIGDSRGYLWKITIDRERGLGKIEKVSGLNDKSGIDKTSIDGSMHNLHPQSDVRDNMQNLTNMIESRFEAA